MSTHRLLQRSVLAGFFFTGFDDLPALTAERPSAPAHTVAGQTAAGKAATAAARQQPRPAVNRPLTANDVWGQDYARARAQAKALDRPVLLHFHATWCGPCQQMERSVLNTSDVLKEVHSCCVAVKIDSDRYPDLVQQFGVNALPCDLLVRPDGEFLTVNQGAVPADQYKALISNAARARPAMRANVKVAHN